MFLFTVGTRVVQRHNMKPVNVNKGVQQQDLQTGLEKKKGKKTPNKHKEKATYCADKQSSYMRIG